MWVTPLTWAAGSVCNWPDPRPKYASDADAASSRTHLMRLVLVVIQPARKGGLLFGDSEILA